MQQQSSITSVTCLECQQQLDFYAGLDSCPACGGEWLDAQCNYPAVADVWRTGLASRTKSLGRYAELLPILDVAQAVSMGEGDTPLAPTLKLQQRLNHPAIFIKDERQSPISSFKDRQAAMQLLSFAQSNPA